VPSAWRLATSAVVAPKDHRGAVRPGAAQRPGVGQVGQVADGDHQLGVQRDVALEGQEALQGGAGLLTPVGDAAWLGNQGRVGLVGQGRP
jgi:hypothetical protein